MSEFVMAFFAGYFFGAVTIGILWVRAEEKRRWNKGICRETGKPWRQFDTASDGSRGYESEGNYMWMSYGFDKLGVQSNEEYR